jgi:hypothetical protein
MRGHGRYPSGCESARVQGSFRLPRLILLSPDIVSRHSRDVRGMEEKIRRRQNPMSVYKSCTAGILLPWRGGFQ